MENKKKILIVLRKWEDEEGVGKAVKNIKEGLEKKGWKVDAVSREDDLKINSMSASMGPLKEFIKVKDEAENYDVIYTQDWSLAFPLLFPKKVFKEKHFCFFHNIQPGENTKVFQKIVGNMLGEKLVVRTEELKEKFPKSTLASDGVKHKLFE